MYQKNKQHFLFPIIFSLGEKEALTKGKKIKRGLLDYRVGCVHSALLGRSLRHWRCWKGTSLLPISLNSILEMLIKSKAHNLFFFFFFTEGMRFPSLPEPLSPLPGCSALFCSKAERNYWAAPWASQEPNPSHFSNYTVLTFQQVLFLQQNLCFQRSFLHLGCNNFEKWFWPLFYHNSISCV